MFFRPYARCPLIGHVLTAKTNLILVFISSVSWRKLSQEPACPRKLAGHMMSSWSYLFCIKADSTPIQAKTPPMKSTSSNRKLGSVLFSISPHKVWLHCIIQFFFTVKWWQYWFPSKSQIINLCWDSLCEFDEELPARICMEETKINLDFI